MAKRTAMAMAAWLLIGAAPPAPGERVVTGDGVVEAQVNGAPARVRIDPGAMAMPMIDADLAVRAKLHMGKLSWGFMARVGPTLVSGPTTVGRIALGASAMPRRIGWSERRYQPDVDGAVGPGGLAEPIVRFQLRAPTPGERTAALPMVDDGGLFGGWGPRYAVVTAGAVTLRVRFAPRMPRSFAGPNTAARITAVLGGRLEGGAEPEPVMFGVSLPVRGMTLARPLVVGPMSLIHLGVYVPQTGTTAPIGEVAGAPSDDPDEVVVTARSRHKPRPGTLTLGADTLARCSSIVFDKPAHQVRLTCA